MSIPFLTAQIDLMENTKRENRQKVANIVLENQNFFKGLITITFDVEHKVSIKAA